MKRFVAFALAGALAAFGWTQSALAWSREGHRAVAHIAHSLLTPEARKQVDTLLGDDTGTAFLAASTWPDEIRGLRGDRPYPDSGPWHYVTIPLTEPSYVREHHCKTGACVVGKIDQFNGQITDTALLPKVRRDALAFLIHFVGDLHQPLHTEENGGLVEGQWVGDRGGNDAKLSIGGRETNLHSLWDDGIIRASWAPADVHAARLAAHAPEKIYKWAAGTPAAWATESHRIASRFVYPSLGQRPTRPGPIEPAVIMPADYATKMRPIADAQIVKAGIRLAMLLNQDFSRP